MNSKPLKIIEKTVKILDSVDYSNYIDKKVEGYLEYISEAQADEDKLIKPKLFLNFLEKILGFELGKTVGTEESISKTGKYPDFTPVDTRTHPFVFDVKGTDTKNLSEHYDQINEYMESHPNGLKYGILTNMRTLGVFTTKQRKRISEYSFSFRMLFQDYKDDHVDILEEPNTRRFLQFVEKFRYRKLTLEEKFERIKAGTPWTGEEKLNVSLLANCLHSVVEILYEDVKEQKAKIDDIREYDPDQARNIAQEIELIASEISRDRELHEASIDTLKEILESPSDSLYAQALNTFLYRVAYFTMTRLLLVRMWEDIGFIDQTLYDGGLATWYERFNREIRRVLEHAFRLAGEKYEWLFKVENNYTWYEPSDDPLIRVLYELSNFNLGKLNRDVLGTIYEEYIDRVDKKNKGQYYTPRQIVSFIWDRVGFDNPESYFKQIRGERKPARILDPASGSGGFLVEAARRLREESNLSLNDFQDLLDIRSGIFEGLFGAEISVFPYYITEVNLLIQLTPVIKRMIELQKALKGEHLPLPVVRVDALSLHNTNNYLLENNEEYKADKLRDVLPLDSRKKYIWQKIKEDFAGEFDYCCANPPYIGEKGHKNLFRDTKKRFPYWENFYKGKMDYFYWFIILGLSKLKEGGKLGFVTTSYWPISKGASILRKYILEKAKIKEMIFFNDVKLFEHAKGQHSMVFIIEKCSGKVNKQSRANTQIKIVNVTAKNTEIPGSSISNKLEFLKERINEHIKEDAYQDEYIHIFWGGLKQGDLPSNGDPWNEVYVPKSIVEFTAKIEAKTKKLDEVMELRQGIVPGVDRVTKRNIKRLPDSKIQDKQIKIGDGIFVLSQEEAKEIGSTVKEQDFLFPSYRNSHICSYIVDIPRENEEYLLYLDKEIKLDQFDRIRKHLNKYRELLEYRLEKYGESYPWYRLHRPRDRKLLSREKIVVSNWGESWQPFAYQSGNYFEKRDITILVKKPHTQEHILYLLGLLNSKLIKTWMQLKTEQTGYMRQGLQKQIPIRRINFSKQEEIEIQNKVTKRVKSIMGKMYELAKYSKYFEEPRLTKLEPQESIPEANTSAIVEGLPPKQLYSIRTHPDLHVLKSEEITSGDFYLNSIGEIEQTLEDFQIQLKAKNKMSLFIQGSEKLLELLTKLLKDRKGESWSKINEKLLLPKSFDAFKNKEEKILTSVRKLRKEIEELQEEIDQIVFELYGVSDSEI